MKNLMLIVALLGLFLLPSCGSLQEFNDGLDSFVTTTGEVLQTLGETTETVGNAVAVADPKTGSSISGWGTLLGAIGGVLGLNGVLGNRRRKKETDELWDKVTEASERTRALEAKNGNG